MGLVDNQMPVKMYSLSTQYPISTCTQISLLIMYSRATQYAKIAFLYLFFHIIGQINMWNDLEKIQFVSTYTIVYTIENNSDWNNVNI